eukprot:1780704-Pyramimonas_sp.AAC.1
MRAATVAKEDQDTRLVIGLVEHAVLRGMPRQLHLPRESGGSRWQQAPEIQALTDRSDRMMRMAEGD